MDKFIRVDGDSVVISHMFNEEHAQYELTQLAGCFNQIQHIHIHNSGVKIMKIVF